MKSTASGDFLAKKLWLLADNPDNTISKLSAPSPAVPQLIQEAEKNMRELDTERNARRALESENASLKSAEMRGIYVQVLRFIVAVVYLCVARGESWYGLRAEQGVALCYMSSVCSR